MTTHTGIHLVAGMTVAIAGTASAQLDPHFPAGESMVEVPFTTALNSITVKVRINGSGPLDLVLDTGTPDTVVFDPRRLPDVAFPATGHGHHGVRRAKQPIRLDIGGLVLDGAEVVALPEQAVRNIGPLPDDGILGAQLFESVVVQVDWQENRLRMYDPQTFEAPADTTVVPIEKRRGYIYTTVDVTVDGVRRPVTLIVDTGAGHAVALRADRVAPPERRVSQVMVGRGLGGALHGDLGRLDTLRIGTTTLEGVLATFLDRAASMIAVGSDGNLGVKVLNRFVVTFDYGRSRMLLEPTDAVSDPFPFSRTGLALENHVADDGSIGIVDVYADSPADRAGVVAGDRIVAVDAKKVSELGLAGVADLLKRDPGTLVTLRILRHDSVRSVEIELATIL